MLCLTILNIHLITLIFFSPKIILNYSINSHNPQIKTNPPTPNTTLQYFQSKPSNILIKPLQSFIKTQKAYKLKTLNCLSTTKNTIKHRRKKKNQMHHIVKHYPSCQLLSSKEPN